MDASSLVFLIVPVFVVAVFALVIAGWVAAARRNRERGQAMHAYAVHQGWRYSADGSGLESRFAGEPFGRGRNRRAGQVLEGTYAGWPFLAFDYSYVTSNGKSSTTHTFSVMSMHLGAFVPRLQVRPQSAVGRFFSDAFGGDDYRIGYPVFDEAFHVSTNSPEFAHDVMSQPMCDLLLATRGRALRFDGDSLLLFRSGSHDPAEVAAVLELMRHILEQVPTPVWERLHGDDGGNLTRDR